MRLLRIGSTNHLSTESKGNPCFFFISFCTIPDSDPRHCTFSSVYRLSYTYCPKQCLGSNLQSLLKDPDVAPGVHSILSDTALCALRLHHPDWLLHAYDKLSVKE